MSLMDINWNPSRKDVRIFGTAALAVSVLLAAVFYFFKGLGIHWAISFLAIGLVVFICCMFSHKLGKMIYLALTIVTFPIGLVVNFIVLFVFYYLLITPLGLFFRLMGRDMLGKKFDPNAKSYWQSHASPQPPERYFRQF